MKQINKKVMLMTAPFYRLYGDDSMDGSHNIFPLGVGYLAAMILDRTGWTCRVVNGDAKFGEDTHFNMPLIRMAGEGFQNYLKNLNDLSAPIWKEMEETIREFDPDVLGISATSQNWVAGTVLAGIAKRLKSDIIVVVGGPHASMAKAKTLECPDIDINVAGEGEDVMVDILTAIESGVAFGDVAGISFRVGETITTTPPRPFIEDLDTIPFPITAAKKVLKDYEKYPADSFRSMFAIRGCPYFCQFCGSRTIWSRKSRFRSPENVIAEMKALQAIGVQHIHFEDDMFGIKKAYIKELCGLIQQECPDVTWSGEMTVTITNDENLQAMKDAGCIAISLGIESGNNEMLKTIRKTQTIEESHAAVDLIQKHGIKTSTFFMVGFPDETEDTMNDTMKSMETINTDNIIFSIFTPYPDTEMFGICMERGLIADDFDVCLYNHQSLENCFTDRIEPQRFKEMARQFMARVDDLNSQKFARYQEKELQKIEQNLANLRSEMRYREWVLEKFRPLGEMVDAFGRYQRQFGLMFALRKTVGFVFKAFRRTGSSAGKNNKTGTFYSGQNVTGPTYLKDD